MRKTRKKKKHVILRSSGLLILGVLLFAGGRALRRTAQLPSASDAPGQPGAWNVILVNAQNPIPEGFEVELAPVSGGHRFDARAAFHLEAMLEAARQEGLDPVICSSYRTREKQQTLYTNKVQQYIDEGYSAEEAEAQAARWVAPPDTSEHQLGLAVDIVASSYQRLDKKQEETAEQQWLMAHCHEYGFILRYPSDKSDITGIAYEPWHYRYVGAEAAKAIAEQGVCLEEYLAGLA